MLSNSKMIYPQLIILFGAISVAFGSFWAWKISHSEQWSSGLAQQSRADHTDSLIIKSTDTILAHQSSKFDEDPKRL